MKFQIQLKDPDGFYDAKQDAAKASAASVEGLTDEVREELEESRSESLGEFLAKWVEYGEYIKIEFDTDAKTATVVPRS